MLVHSPKTGRYSFRDPLFPIIVSLDTLGFIYGADDARLPRSTRGMDMDDLEDLSATSPGLPEDGDTSGEEGDEDEDGPARGRRD
jgi:hypothetical protein